MSTSEPPDLTGLSGEPSGTTELASTMAKQIERLANELFQGVPAMNPASGGLPGPAMNVPFLGGAMPPMGAPMAAPGALVPPHFGPNALNVGAGGASPAVGLPPVPGFMHALPLAATPAPKESDLRTIPAMLSEGLGVSSPVALAGAQDPASMLAASQQGSMLSASQQGSMPYFLELAGLPAGANAGAWPAVALGAAPPGVATLPAPRAGAEVPPKTVGGVPQADGLSAPLAMLPHAFQPELVPDLGIRSGIFDPNAIKRDFPILEERIHGRRLVWLDNAATTQKPQVVIDRISYYYEHENSNVHRAAHTLAARATDAFEGARDKVRRLLNAPSVKDIVFVRGATEGINLIAKSWGARNVGPGDEIVITWLEHHANIVPWQQLCLERGARLRVAPVDDQGQVILEAYERLLGPRTRIVSLSQVSNALGTILPAKEMVEMAHRHGARVVVDGAQAVSHMPVDVQDLDCDFYAFSGHKIFAPTGIGAIFGKGPVLETMPPWQGGGNMIADVTFEKTTYQPPPGRFEAGTGSIADAVGLGAAIDYVMMLGLENISRYEHELRLYAEERLARVPGLTMIGTAKEKAGVLSFVLDGVRTEDVGAALDQEGIAVRSGHHCAQPILRRFGLESTVRASLAPYNTCEDIDALVAALLRLQGGMPVPALD